MNDTLMLLLSVCAVLLVVGGLLAVGGFLLIRFLAGGSLFEALGFDGLGDLFGREQNDQAASPSRPARRRPNLTPPDLDFDAAVARHAAGDASAQRANLDRQPDQSPFDSDPPSAPPLRKRRRDRNEDELFGGLLDEDGDGGVDF